MNRRNFLGALVVATATSFVTIKEKQPLFYQVTAPTFRAYYSQEGKGVEPALQSRTFVTQIYKWPRSFKHFVDHFSQQNYILIYDYWIDANPVAPYDSAVYVRAVLLNKSIPWILTDFESRYDYTLNKLLVKL